LLGDEPANRSLARAHESDEREIDKMARVVHVIDLTHLPPRRTPEIWRFSKYPAGPR
jgi:hypothetical protein